MLTLTKFINVFAVLAAAASSMVVGAIWYAKPVFENYWMRTADVSMDDAKPAVSLSITAVLSLITAAGLSLLTYLVWQPLRTEVSFLGVALMAALLIWVCFIASRMTTHYLFEIRPTGLMLLNAGHEFVTIGVMALIIGLWVPANIA